MSLHVVQALNGIYRYKQVFQRERRARASNYLSYFLMDPVPAVLLSAMGELVVLVVVYSLAGLRAFAGMTIYVLCM